MQKVWCLSEDILPGVCPWTFCPIHSPPHFGPIMPTTLGKTTPPGWTSPDQAKEQTDAARRRARQGIREYELIWLLQQRLRALSWPHWRLRCMLQPHCTATAWELSDLDHSHAATPQASVCHARFRCSAPAFCAWRRPPLICLKLLVGVYVRDGLAASVCVYRTCAASVELLPRGWRALDFPRWLHDQSCLTWATRLIVILIVRCCFGGSCVYETGLLLLCACRASTASI